jgi:hypothetical protein
MPYNGAHLLQSVEDCLSTVFAGPSVGIKQVSEHIWLVSFMDYDLHDRGIRTSPIGLKIQNFFN